MSENTEVQTEVQAAPKSDAEAALREQAAPEGQATPAAETTEGEAKPDKAEKPNRTRAYIERLQNEVAELRRRDAERLATPQNTAQTASTPQATDGEPKLADFNYDLEAYNRAHARWVFREEMKQEREHAEAASAQKSQHDAMTAYQERVWQFEETHPDYLEAVDSFFEQYQPSPQVQMAVIRHERGPEIAYYLANNDDEAWAISTMDPRHADTAVARLVKRMDATQQAPIPPAPTVRTISQAPAPTPRVAGRSVAVVPPEKQTDDDWYKADVERRRKR